MTTSTVDKMWTFKHHKMTTSTVDKMWTFKHHTCGLSNTTK